MDYLFVLKIALSFAVGSLWITAGTVIAERYGTKIGGLVAGLPSTILISMFFIGWTQSPEVAAAATTVVPLIGGINCLFVVTYMALVRRSVWFGFSAAILVWFALSSVVVLSAPDNFVVSLALYIILLFLSHQIAERRLGVKSEPGRDVKYRPSMMVYRALFSGFVIVTTVVLAKVGGPLAGGMCAMFPAMFVGTLFITYFAHGASFSAAVMKSSIIGATSVVVFGVGVRYSYPLLGLWAGTIASLAVSFGWSIAVHRFAAMKTA
jgi:MFS family permease